MLKILLCFSQLRDKILLHLNMSEKKVAREVCHSWKQLINQHLTFGIFLTDDTFKIVEGMDGNQNIVLMVMNCTKEIPSTSSTRSSFAKNINYLVLCDRYFNKGTSQENILRLLRLNQQIEYLSIFQMALERITQPSLLRRVRLECLANLRVLKTY